MVKNTTGGTKTKGLARKHQGGGNRGQLRVPENELEQVAYVEKMLGNGMCRVCVLIDNETQILVAHIRKKFSGRHKRSNLITDGTCLLIGLRDWENPYKNCDVINVYDHNEFQNILDIPSIPTDFIKPLLNRHNFNFDNKNNAEFDFCDHNDYDYDYDNNNDTHNLDIPLNNKNYNDNDNDNHYANDIDLNDI